VPRPSPVSNTAAAVVVKTAGKEPRAVKLQLHFTPEEKVSTGCLP